MATSDGHTENSGGESIGSDPDGGVWVVVTRHQSLHIFEALAVPHAEVSLHSGGMVDGVQQLVPKYGLVRVLGKAARGNVAQSGVCAGEHVAPSKTFAPVTITACPLSTERCHHTHLFHTGQALTPGQASELGGSEQAHKRQVDGKQQLQ